MTYLKFGLSLLWSGCFATAIAEEDACLIALDRPKFLYMVQQQPMFVFTIMHALCDRIREVNLLLAKAKGEEAPR